MTTAQLTRPTIRRLALLWLCFCWSVSQAAGFSVERASSRLVDGVYQMDADLQLDLSDEALKALVHGVPVTILVSVAITRYRQYLWDESVARLEQRYQLQFHPLSERYVVLNRNTGITRNFQTLDDALLAVGRLRNYPLLAQRLLEPEQAYSAEVEVSLDIEALPAPMRPLAYFDNQWRLSSDPYEWPLNP